jgi:hypothetical protein
MKDFYERYYPPMTGDDDEDPEPRAPKCNRCGSTQVRWRQQGGKWVLFSLKPGIEHVCPVVDEFDVLPD